MANEPSKRSFQEYITGAKEGRITDGSLPDGRPLAQAVDTANRAVKEKLARDARDESPVEGDKAPRSGQLSRYLLQAAGCNPDQLHRRRLSLLQ